MPTHFQPTAMLILVLVLVLEYVPALPGRRHVAFPTIGGSFRFNVSTFQRFNAVDG